MKLGDIGTNSKRYSEHMHVNICTIVPFKTVILSFFIDPIFYKMLHYEILNDKNLVLNIINGGFK